MTSVFENEKKFRKGKKFEEKETEGEMFRKKLKEEKMKKGGIKEKPPIQFKRRKPNRAPGEGRGRIIAGEFYPAMAKGGRVGLKAGSKGCKLAMKGKGRAYGKNS